MKISSTWRLLYVFVVQVAYGLKSTPYRTVNCSVDETRYYEVTVNDMQNELFLNCMNASLTLKPVTECLKIRTVVLLLLDSCNLHASLPAAVLRNLKSLSLSNSLTDDVFFISNLSIEFLSVHKLSAKELCLDNLLFLKHLAILNMNWKTILGKPFRNLDRLKTLSLTNNQLEHLEEDTFQDLTQLLILHLSGNKLQTLPNNLFQSTRRLEYLSLNRNHFTYLNSTAFTSLKSIIHLTISEDTLKKLPEDLLISNPELEHINLSGNTELDVLPRGFLKNSRKLKSFNISNCNLRFLAADTFSFCPLLRRLSLANNKLNAVAPNTFFSFPLSYLDLSGNSLTGLPSDLFGSNHRLEHLDLSRNRLSRIPTSAFTDMFTLVELILSHNEIDAVDAKDFDFLTNLRTLDLSSNKIKYLHSLGKAKSLLLMNLSSNLIQAFPNISYTSYKVKFIDLSGNNLRHISTAGFSFAAGATINLQHNKITSLNFDRSVQEDPLILYLGFNPFACNCSLKKLVQHLQNEEDSYPFLSIADVGKLACHSPAAWKGKALTDILPLRLCPVRSSCPIKCHCFEMQDQKVLVNCTMSELTGFPTVLPPNTTTVHLEGNRIHDLRISKPETWKNVSSIHLDRNELTSIASWRTPPSSLKLLSLRNNNLTTLPDSLLELISKAPLFTLDIRGNPWICNCDFLAFKRWFIKHLDKLAAPKDVLCRRVVNHTTVQHAIQEIPEDAFCEPRLPYNTTTPIVLAIVLTLGSLVLIAIVVSYYRYNDAILAYVYVHARLLYCCSSSRVDRDKLYDAFISYTAYDRDTVLDIVNELETKPPYFNLCLHERDWIAGYPITSQIETSVANSKKTIVILTKDYLESFWCETEFQVAYLQSLEDRIDRIIIIVKGDLPEQDTMPLDMQNLLANKTYLVWGERWFVEKLRYALPHYASPVGGKDILKIEQVEGMISTARCNR